LIFSMFFLSVCQSLSAKIISPCFGYASIRTNPSIESAAACIASILELSLDMVPNFVGNEFDGGENCHQACRKWLNERGLYLVDVNLKNEEEIYSRLDWYFLQGAYCIASVPSQRFKGGWHSVVMQLRKIDESSTRLVVAHDPNELNQPYGEDVKIRRLQFIVPFVPKIK